MKLRLAFLTALLLASQAALQGGPPDGAIFLGAEQAQMIKPGSESAPVKSKPVPVLDGDGFPVDQVVQSVAPEAEIQRQIREYAENLYPQFAADYPDKLKAWEAAVIQAQSQGKGLPAKPPEPALPGGFPASFFSEGRFEHYGANDPLRIANLAPFAVRGIVWDQGEGGTGIAGADQTAVMLALVRSWRAAWGTSALPFIYVNKKNFTAAHRDALAMLPPTARADYEGLSTINHPPDKAAYARRIVEQMEQLVYQPATR